MDRDIINSIKNLGIDMISEAKSGHPGITLSAAPIIYTLYAKHLNINVNDPNWLNRDRFVLSAGHASALLYATLFMAGYNITVDDLKKYRKAGSKLSGHPEYNKLLGIDISTGLLGEGIGNAVGMALASKILKSKYFFERKNFMEVNSSLIDYNVYVLCSDGDLMEGISYEAASLAGNLKLNNLIILYDSNNISMDGETSKTFSENVLDRFKALGWNTEFVKNGDDVNEIDKAISRAKGSSKPSIVEIKTVLGKGSKLQGTNEVHGKVLDKDDISNLKTNLGIPDQPFYYNEAAKNKFNQMIFDRSNKKYEQWADNYRRYVNENLSGQEDALNYLFNDNATIDLVNKNFRFEKDIKEATRVTNTTIMKEIVKMIPNFIGGSADVSVSTRTYLIGENEISNQNYNGKYINFGVREKLVGAVLNGLAVSGFRPFGSTFLAFSDYMKPSIRMSALMNLPVTYIFSHDSISIGSDGPTHQPVEQLSNLRSIPNLDVYRPCDANELVGCWHEIINNKRPSALILSKQEVDLLPVTSPKYVRYGAYIVRKEKEMDGILIATGTEVHTALILARDLYINHKLDFRVMTMPSMELFLRQPVEIRKMLIPQNINTYVIEAGTSFGWQQFVEDEDHLFTVNDFGISGSKDENYTHCHFDYKTIKEGILKTIKK